MPVTPVHISLNVPFLVRPEGDARRRKLRERNAGRGVASARNRPAGGSGALEIHRGGAMIFGAKGPFLQRLPEQATGESKISVVSFEFELAGRGNPLPEHDLGIVDGRARSEGKLVANFPGDNGIHGEVQEPSLKGDAPKAGVLRPFQAQTVRGEDPDAKGERIILQAP